MFTPPHLIPLFAFLVICFFCRKTTITMATNNPIQDVLDKARKVHEPYAKKNPNKLTIQKGEVKNDKKTPRGYESEKNIPKNRMNEIETEMLSSARRRGIDTNEWDRVDINERLAYDLSEKVIRKIANVDTKTGEQMAYALLSYTGAAFRDIKEASSKAQPNDFIAQKLVKPLESYIEAAPKYYGETYRGTTKTDSEISNLLNSYNNGKEIAMHGISSWTRDKNVAKDFLFANTQGYKGKKNATVFICKEKQPKGTSVSQYAPPMNENQKEVLVSKDARWKIDSYEERNETVDGKKTKVRYFYLTAV